MRHKIEIYPGPKDDPEIKVKKPVHEAILTNYTFVQAQTYARDLRDKHFPGHDVTVEAMS